MRGSVRFFQALGPDSVGHFPILLIFTAPTTPNWKKCVMCATRSKRKLKSGVNQHALPQWPRDNDDLHTRNHAFLNPHTSIHRNDVPDCSVVIPVNVT